MAKKPKTVCPIQRADFDRQAKPLAVKIGDQEFQVPVKKFSTGSFGWYLNAKTKIDVGGTPVDVQIGLNLTVVGSKDLPPDPTAAPAPATAEAAVPAAAPPSEDESGEG